MVRLTELVVSGTPAAWRAIGLNVNRSVGIVADVVITIHHNENSALSCSFSEEEISDTQPVIDSIDGAPMRLHHSSGKEMISSFAKTNSSDGIAFIGIDHLVITTDDLGRTSAALEHALGVPCARTRDAGHSVTQAFHKLDNTIVELVAGPHVKHTGAKWWGFVLVVEDIDRWWKEVGESVATPPRDAIQHGRKISTIHSSVGLGVAVAVMSPHVRAN